MTENKIHSILTDFGIFISEGEISNILTKEKSDVFSAEKSAIFETSMRYAKYSKLTVLAQDIQARMAICIISAMKNFLHTISRKTGSEKQLESCSDYWRES